MRILLIALLLTLVGGCTPAPQILNVQKRVSRDTTTLTFARNHSPFEHHGIVGGEHISTFQLLGFEGDCYRIEIETTDSGLYLGRLGTDGVEVTKLRSTMGGHRCYQVEVTAPHALLPIVLSAHPVAEYVLRITPLKQGNRTNPRGVECPPSGPP